MKKEEILELEKLVGVELFDWQRKILESWSANRDLHEHFRFAMVMRRREEYAAAEIQRRLNSMFAAHTHGYREHPPMYQDESNKD